jgi:hypothetical protein
MAFSFSRYNNRQVLKNAYAEYIKQLSSRDLQFINHFDTANMVYPTEIQRRSLDYENEVWGVGSRFYKIAEKHYGDPTLWWIIPWFNKLPLEADYEPGEVVLVPKPLNIILSMFE